MKENEGFYRQRRRAGVVQAANENTGKDALTIATSGRRFRTKFR
jgi:hypothetical protein